MKKILATLSLFCSLFTQAQTTYYVNPDIPLSMVNAYTLHPGDVVRFQRNASWSGQLTISQSGTHAAPIRIGTYGTGAMPIIGGRVAWPGWNDTANWVAVSGRPNVWRFVGSYTNTLDKSHRIWLNGVEYPRAKDSSAISPRYPQSYLSETYVFWVYAPSNPATYYNSIEYPGEGTGTVNLYGVNHIEIDSIDMRGSNGGSLVLSGTQDIKVRDCNIGLYAGHCGVTMFNKTDTTLILRPKVNSGDTCKDYFLFQHGLQDGIALNTGTHNCTIESADVRNWGHSDIEFTDVQTDTTGKTKNGLTMSNVSIIKNLLKGADVDYCRGLGLDSRSDHRTSNIFFGYNWLDSFTVRSQAECRNAVLHGNLFSNIRTGTSIGMVSDAGAGLMINPYSYTSGDSMQVTNNTFLNIDEPAIVLSNSSDASYGTIRGTLVANNLAVNPGRHATPDYAMDDIGYAINPLTGPTKIGANTFKNNLSYNASSTNVFFDNRYAVGSQKKTASQWNATNGDTYGNTVSGNQYAVVSLNSNLEPAIGSPVLGAGLTLSSGYNQVVATGSTWPNNITLITQPTAWNIGAYALALPVIAHKYVLKAGGKVALKTSRN